MSPASPATNSTSNPNLSANGYGSTAAPQIYVSDTENSKVVLNNNQRQCALDNSLLSEHFNLDDLSASFRSLYKSVFQATNSNTESNTNLKNGNQVNTKGKVLGFSFILSRFLSREEVLSFFLFIAVIEKIIKLGT